MSILNSYFDRIFCINLDRSPERWEHARSEALDLGFEIERFRGYDFREWDGYPPHLRAQMSNGMCGCSNSHSALYHLIAHQGWMRVLILEDDFEIFHDDFEERFIAMIPFIPNNWDVLYLGAHYGDPPTQRVNKHIVRAGYIKTTSSYAISGRHARIMAPIMATCSGPDDTLSGYNPHCNAYVLHPRLMGQYENVSAIWGKKTNNSLCMREPVHDAIIEGLPY